MALAPADSTARGPSAASAADVHPMQFKQDAEDSSSGSSMHMFPLPAGQWYVRHTGVRLWRALTRFPELP